MAKYILTITILLCTVYFCQAIDHHRWAIKTTPLHTARAHKFTFDEIVGLQDPPGVSMNDSRYEAKRIPAFSNSLNVKEGDLVRVEGYMFLVAYEDNDDEYHIQISGNKESGENCLIVEVPDPKNVDDPALKARYENVRSFIRKNILKGKEPSKTGNLIGGRAYVSVTGQLFYDDAHNHNQVRGKKGMPSHCLWEIHPIIDMKFAPKPR